ncbi:MAG: 2-dehydro-3-deoxygalactonokinase [Jannaschia sp.]
MTRWIAVDWGTTALRATLMDGAEAVETRENGDGMNALTRDRFEPSLLRLTDDWITGPVRILCCGMVGARQGWAEAPYRTVPCTPLGDAAIRVETSDPRLDVRIVPGLRQLAPHPDVMRGEETQIAGILRRIDGFDGVACLPGTHTKWAHLSAGEVVSFRTILTGELFATLSSNTVLRHSLTGDGWEEAPFLDAVSDALSRPEIVTARLFELRAADLLHGQDAAIARSLLSGLLIGAELAATRPWWLGRDVVVTGSARTTRAYAAALQSQGVTPRILQADAMTLAGLTAASDLP